MKKSTKKELNFDLDTHKFNSTTLYQKKIILSKRYPKWKKKERNLILWEVFMSL